MCKVSDKLKLCTCSTNIEKLKHYWVLHRFIDGKDELVIGEPMLPVTINEQDDLYNWRLLEKLLNDGNVFDIEIQPKENDRLELSFLCQPVLLERIAYGFSYSNGRWVKEEYDGLEWMWHHEEEKFGKIIRAIKKMKDEVLL